MTIGKTVPELTAETPPIVGTDEVVVYRAPGPLKRATTATVRTYMQSNLGTMATQNANAVAITGGTITGITDLAVADGGTGAGTADGALTNFGGTTVGKAVFTAANAAAARTATGTVIGTDVQAYDPDLTTWAGITPGTGVGTALAVNVGSAGAFTTFNGAGGTPSSMTLTNATGLPIAGLVSSTSTALGVGSLELGNASDTTLARSSAGNVTIEGNLVYRAGGTDVPITDGGTGSSTAADARTALGTDLATNVNYTPSGTSVATRTVAAKLFDGGYSPKDHTLTGSGTIPSPYAGSGVTLALTDAYATLQGAPVTGMTWDQFQQGVLIPPGVYDVPAGGYTQASGNIYLIAQVPGTVQFNIGANDYFMTLTGNLQNLYVSGINFRGGKGVLADTGTGTQVAGNRVFQDVRFDFQTECCVYNSASDGPYWKFDRCQFFMAGSNGIAVALGGWLDGSSFTGCEFLRHKYALKLGDRLSGSISISRCDFLEFASGVRGADIWFIPNTTDSPGANSGIGTNIENCRFGNEQQLAGDVRILVAMEDGGTGTHRGNIMPSTTFNTTGWVTGISFRGNRLSSVAGSTVGFIRSYVQKFASIAWDATNQTAGQYKHLVEFMSEPNERVAYALDNWQVNLGPSTAAQQPFTSGISNVPVGLFIDNQGLQPCEAATLLTHNSSGDDVNYASIVSATGAAGLTTLSATITAVTDGLGNASRAANVAVTAASADSMVYAGLGTPTAGKMIWIELDLKTGASNSVTSVTVSVFNYTAGVLAFSRVVKLPTTWTTQRWGFYIPASASPSEFVFRVNANEYTAVTAINFCVGRVKIYYGRQPNNGGHLRTIGDGLWNGEHIVMGGQHMWIDSSTRLRIKSSAPTSDTDGTVVGTQT
jgi:hypothetical protein